MKPTSDFCYVDIGSIDNKNQKLGNTENIITPDKAPSRARKTIDIGDIIYSTVRPYLHNMCIIDKQFSLQPIASTGFATMTCYSGIFNKYLFYYLLAPDFDNYANDTENSKGVAYPAINDDRLYKALIPVAPLAEQKRIVAKIEELLPFIEKYEQAETKLTALNKSFPEMLKKSILQEAVQGKLVPQNPDDEPASILLERIRAEKQELIRQGKIKKSKHESIIVTRDKIPYEIIDGKEHCIADEVPFEIPESWEWCRVGSIFTLQAGKNISANQIVEDLVEGLQPCFGGNGIRGYVPSFNREGNYPIIGRQVALCGNINLANGQFYATEHAVCVKTFANTDVLWCCYFLTALNLNQYATATAQPGLAVANINEVFIPLPPLAEQKRIVKKIEELMPMINSISK